MGLPRCAKVKTRSEQRQQPHRGHLGDDEREQFLRRRVDPVQIFDDGEHGVLRRHREHGVEQRLQRPLLLAFRAHRRRRKARGRRQRQQRGQQRQALGGRDAVALAELDQLVLSRRVGIAATPAEHAPEQRDHRIQRAVGAVFRAAQLEQHVRPVRDVRHHRLHETRLADPGIPHDQDDASLPLGHLLPAVVQEPELLVATDQRRGSDARRRGSARRRVRAERGEGVRHRCRSGDLPDLHRCHEALDREHPEVLVREAIAGEAPRAVRNHDPVRRGQGLQACGEIRCLAQRDPLANRTRLGQVADDHEAGRHADAHVQRPADPVELPDPGDEREPGANGAHGVVVVAVGVAEIDHGTVAEQQRHEAIEFPHRVRDAPMVGADHVAEILRVELRRQLGGSHQVAEEYGELPSLRALCAASFGDRVGRVATVTAARPATPASPGGPRGSKSDEDSTCRSDSIIASPRRIARERQRYANRGRISIPGLRKCRQEFPASVAEVFPHPAFPPRRMVRRTGDGWSNSPHGHGDHAGIECISFANCPRDAQARRSTRRRAAAPRFEPIARAVSRLQRNPAQSTVRRSPS